MSIEKLKATFAASSPGSPLYVEPHVGQQDSIWIGSADAYYAQITQKGSGLFESDDNAAQFIALSHNMAPDLIRLFEAVDEVMDDDGDLRSMDLSEIVNAMRHLKGIDYSTSKEGA